MFDKNDKNKNTMKLIFLLLGSNVYKNILIDSKNTEV